MLGSSGLVVVDEHLLDLTDGSARVQSLKQTNTSDYNNDNENNDKKFTTTLDNNTNTNRIERRNLRCLR